MGGAFFLALKERRREEREGAGDGLETGEALRQPASAALSRGSGAEAQGAPELALDTRVYPEPEDCVSPPRAV